MYVCSFSYLMCRDVFVVFINALINDFESARSNISDLFGGMVDSCQGSCYFFLPFLEVGP